MFGNFCDYPTDITLVKAGSKEFTGKFSLLTGKIKERFDSLGVVYKGTSQGSGDMITSTAVRIPIPLKYYFHSDHLGSSSLITDGAGALVQHLEYIPFGEVFIDERPSAGSWSTPYKFNAKELDEETGLYYYGARYYDPRTSVWISADPLKEKYPNVSSYVYCLDNPVKYIDPDGRDWAEVQSGKGKDLKNQIKWFESKTAFEKSGEKGQYLGKAVAVFNGSKAESLGKDGTLTGKGANPADVTIYGIKGKDDINTYNGLTMTSDPSKFSVLNDGWYDGTPDKMSNDRVYNYFSSADRAKHVDTTPSLPYRLSQNGDYILEGTKNNEPITMSGVFFHRTNTDGFSGVKNGHAISEGCPVVNGANWRDIKKSLGTNITIKFGLFRK